MNSFLQIVKFDMWRLNKKYLTYSKLEQISEGLGARKQFQGRNLLMKLGLLKNILAELRQVKLIVAY